MADITKKPLRDRLVFAAVYFATAGIMALAAWKVPVAAYIGPMGPYIALAAGIGGLIRIARNA